MDRRRAEQGSQAEHWEAEGRRLAQAGEDESAFAHYRRAASLMPGAPWLQQRTAELARKLDERELAVVYFRRASSAFLRAGFRQRALAPLREAWLLARMDLPTSLATFREVAGELSGIQRALGRALDAEVTEEQTDTAVRRAAR